MKPNSSAESPLLEHLSETLQGRQLLPRADSLILIAYSGGADSTALLHAMTQLQSSMGFRLCAAHLNHLLRPNAHADVTACQAFCESLGVPMVVGEADVAALAREKRLSIEEAGREARYAFFRTQAAQLGADRIATAHTRDDQIETMLINLMRGTGTRGLRGIPLQRDDIIRPLLFVSRAQTHAYCEAHGLPVQFDSTNLDPRQLRGRIRRELMPLLQDLSPGFAESLLRLGDLMETEEDWWEARLETMLSNKHLLSQLPSLHRAEQRRVVRALIQQHLPPGESPSFEAVERLLDALVSGKSLHWNFSNGFIAEVKAGQLSLHMPTTKVSRYAYKVQPGESLWIQEAGCYLHSQVEPPPESFSGEAVWIDKQAIIGSLMARNRRPGDRFEPLNLHHSKRLSDIFTDRKWDRVWRERCPLLSDETGLLWVPGYTIAHRARVTLSTKQCLKLWLERVG